MYHIGISGGVLAGNQDGAAAIISDGKIIAAVEEERMSGIKHANGLLPRRALIYCLQEAGISIRDVASVTFPGATYRDFDTTLKDYFEFHFGYSPKIVLRDHHTCHAASAFYYSGFDDSMVVTADFSGDRTSTTVFHATASGLKEVLRIHKPNSLGIFYSVLTQYLGYEKDDEEYKVMGLSSYGQPKYGFDGVIKPDGDSYIFNEQLLKSTVNPSAPAASKQERLFTELPLERPMRLSADPIDQYYMDVAASGQKALEDCLLNLVKHYAGEMGAVNMCFAGGVALNCVANQKIRESGILENLFVPPHTSDAGLAIGAATLSALEDGGPRPAAMGPCYWGPGWTDEEIQKALDVAGLKYERPANIADEIADDIAAGKIVGWFQGRMEFGPRALGNRSILADPRVAEMKDRINAAIKFREGYRPFAPSVLEENAGDYFVDACRSPYMTLTFDVKPEKRDVVPAITHVDGTARVQTVSADDNPLYHQLISAVGARTGVPMVVNTSMNVRGQPIVLDARQAAGLFYSTGLSSMAIGPFLLRK